MAIPTPSKWLTCAVFGIVLSLPIQTARAQDFSPVAVINDEIVTGFDVEQRQRLVQAASAGGATAMGREAAIDALIEDTLRIQAARRAGIDPGPKEIDAGFNELASLSQRDPTEVRNFFRSQGVTDEALALQIKAEVAWRQLILQRYGERSRVTESDLDEAGLGASRANDRFHLAQLVVPVAPDAPQTVADTAFAQAAQVRGQLSSCADVEARKAAFSPISGDLGVRTLADMPQAVRDAVSGLQAGQVSQPVRSNDGVHVLVVCERQAGAAPAGREAAAELRAKRLERYARSLLRELRREAVIDRR